MTRRATKIEVRMSASEKAALGDEAKAAGFSVSALVRQRALGEAAPGPHTDPGPAVDHDVPDREDWIRREAKKLSLGGDMTTPVAVREAAASYKRRYGEKVVVQ